jgi:hypothetical protein
MVDRKNELNNRGLAQNRKRREKTMAQTERINQAARAYQQKSEAAAKKKRE